MNSFTLTAVGNLARNPELVAKGDVAYTRFCLVGSDYAGKDEVGVPREIVTSLWFVAFGALGEAIARHSRKGDQLVVEARVRANVWTDKQGEKQYDHDFVVQGFRFGSPGRAKREELNGRELSVRREGEPNGSVDVGASRDSNGGGGEATHTTPEVARATTEGDAAAGLAERAMNNPGTEKSAGGKSGSEKPNRGRRVNASAH